MSVGLATRGYFGGGGGSDATAPVITIVSPTPGVRPGEAGGFPADWATARVTPIVIRVVSDDLTFTSVTARYPVTDANASQAVRTVVYQRDAFRPPFATASSAVMIDPSTLELTILPDDGWPSFKAITQLRFNADAVAGGVLSDVEEDSFLLPPAPALVPVPVATTFDPIPMIDPIALALARMPQQYRGVDDVATDLIA